MYSSGYEITVYCQSGAVLELNCMRIQCKKEVNIYFTVQ